MHSNRSMFASTVVDYKVAYVYGGISQGSQGFNSLAQNIIERYDAIANKWSLINVNNVPNLSSFGWCQGTIPGEIFVLGGSDGYFLQSSLWRINLTNGRGQDLGVEYDSQVCLNKLALSHNKFSGKTILYSFGGPNSEGFGFKCDIHNRG